MINDRYMNLIEDDFKKSYLLYKKGNTDMQAFSSHQPVLIHLLNTIKEGDVMEFGMGWNSTPIMHLICGMQCRNLYSIETNPEWFTKFKLYRSSWHQMVYLLNPKVFSHEFLKRKYSIAFVDGSPAELRQPVIELIKDKADYIIVHDTECVWQGIRNVYNYDFSMFKHVKHFRHCLPSTSLISNLDGFNEDALAIFS